MAPIYFDLPQKSDETEVAETYRWTDRHVVQERNTIMAESGPNFLSALLNVGKLKIWKFWKMYWKFPIKMSGKKYAFLIQSSISIFSFKAFTYVSCVRLPTAAKVLGWIEKFTYTTWIFFKKIGGVMNLISLSLTHCLNSTNNTIIVLYWFQ